MIGERGKEWAGRIGSRKAENRRGPTPGVAAPAEIGHPARGDNARPRKEGERANAGDAGYLPAARWRGSGGHRKWARRGGIRTGRFAVLE